MPITDDNVHIVARNLHDDETGDLSGASWANLSVRDRAKWISRAKTLLAKPVTYAPQDELFIPELLRLWNAAREAGIKSGDHEDDADRQWCLVMSMYGEQILGQLELYIKTVGRYLAADSHYTDTVNSERYNSSDTDRANVAEKQALAALYRAHAKWTDH